MRSLTLKGPEISSYLINIGFPGKSVGKESACQCRRPVGSIPGLGIPLEEDMETHSSVLAWRIPMHRGVWEATVHGVAKSQT